MTAARRGIRGLALALLALAACTVGPVRSAGRPPKAAAPRVTLAVMIVVDGLSWDRLSLYRPWFVSGLKRLLDEGRVETACRYRHLNTLTGPGHASIGTGVPPRLHGIVGNAWYEAAEGGALASVYCTDARTPDGKRARGGGNLRVPTLGDRLVETHPASRVVSLSAKDRAAILLAGRNPTHSSYWFEPDRGIFVNAGAEAHETSPLVAAFNAASAGDNLRTRFGSSWKALSAEGAAARPTAVPGPKLLDYQIPSLGLGWDHALVSDRRAYGSLFYGSPFIDTLLADLALAVIEDDTLALGRRGTPDLLALSFTAHDTVAHNYGPESEEALDVLRRLDVQIGRVLDGVERRVGKERVVLALSADHGFSPIPEAERSRNPRYEGGRLPDGSRTIVDFVGRLNRHLAEDLCLAAGSKPLLGNHGWSLTYDRAAFPMLTVEGACGPAGRGVAAADVDRVLDGAVRRLFAEEIEGVWLVSQRESWPPEHPATEFVRNACDPERSGDAFLVPRPGVIIHWDPGRGSTHGSHFDHDTHVPLVFWGGAFRPEESARPTTPYDLAPTLAFWIGVGMKPAGR